MSLRISQKRQSPTRKETDAIDHWILIHAPDHEVRFAYAAELQVRRKQSQLKTDDDQVVSMDLPNKRQTHLSSAAIKPNTNKFKTLKLARDLLKPHTDLKAGKIGIYVTGYDEATTESLIESIVAAVMAANGEMPQYKKTPTKANPIKSLVIFGSQQRHGYKRTLAEGEGNTLARSLSMLPPNFLTPTDYLKRVKLLAKEHKCKLEFYDVPYLKKKKAGAFLAVAQGSPVNDAGIVRLRYQPQSPKGKKVILVGKGICYDTGGTNLKPARYMFGMHEDMQGSAVALSTFLTLVKMKVRFPMECWLALAMNHIGPKAYKPNDVVTACDGTNIEVVHTDAEGRMILSDTLVMASNTKPGLIIDYATLTGACIYSLGTAYSGVFTNQDQYHQKLIQAGRDSGERVWPFPIDEDYDEAIESDIADVKQCALEGNADHILASRFLKRFVKHDTPWIHVDLSSSNRKGGLAHIGTDTTGFGIRFTLNLLLDQEILT